MRLPLPFMLLLACAPPAPQGPEPVADPLPYASPLMGTGGFAYFHGSAFPGACVPHGLAKVGPDTRGAQYGDLRFIHYSGYWAGDDTVLGFSHLHLHGAGAVDWGALTLMPVTSSEPSVLTREGYQSKFSKRSEKASPGSYEVTLQKWSVKAELTASTWSLPGDALSERLLNLLWYPSARQHRQVHSTSPAWTSDAPQSARRRRAGGGG